MDPRLAGSAAGARVRVAGAASAQDGSAPPGSRSAIRVIERLHGAAPNGLLIMTDAGAPPQGGGDQGLPRESPT